VDLLDAIKNPSLGKDRLKKAATQVMKAKKTAAVAGDFMTQMREKMLARRDAMAGGKADDDSQPAGGDQPAPVAAVAPLAPAADDDDSLSSASDWEESD
jgi:hypothetical protein